jgi:hypothetical protein
VCLHRKMIPQEFYFLSSEKYRPAIFGIPIVISCSPTTSCRGKLTKAHCKNLLYLSNSKVLHLLVLFFLKTGGDICPEFFSG